jgi:hypothetical protein
VWVRIIEAIRNYRPHAAMLRSATNTSEHFRAELEHIDATDAWQYEAIADLFRPVCYLTGKCEFMANFDRKCSIRDRVEMNHEIGRPSNEWHESTVGTGAPINIAAIHPAEWLLDAGAAR